MSKHKCTADGDKNRVGCEGKGTLDSCPSCGAGYVSSLHWISCPYRAIASDWPCPTCEGTGWIETED